MFAWWGMTRLDSSALMPAISSAFLGRVDHDAHGAAKDLLAVHLEVPAVLAGEQVGGGAVGAEDRTTSRSFSFGSYSSTVAPAPSASRTAMLRSLQSTHRERCSEPITRMRLLPVSSRPRRCAWRT